MQLLFLRKEKKTGRYICNIYLKMLEDYKGEMSVVFIYLFLIFNLQFPFVKHSLFLFFVYIPLPKSPSLTSPQPLHTLFYFGSGISFKDSYVEGMIPSWQHYHEEIGSWGSQPLNVLIYWWCHLWMGWWVTGNMHSKGLCLPPHIVLPAMTWVAYFIMIFLLFYMYKSYEARWLWTGLSEAMIQGKLSWFQVDF